MDASANPLLTRRSNEVTPLDAAMASLFHAGRQRPGASEFYRYMVATP
jgi:hypothetical protein